MSRIKKENVMPDSACRICGCTENNACEGGCSWVEDPENLGPLCSKCRADRSWEIPLEQIRPAPWNPPGRMDPAKVKDLADSIKKEGQKQNALIRPVTETLDGPVKYEIVFGHRRYAAKQLLAAKVNAAHAVLRSEIEEMDEEQAMIISGIENLQREGFSDIEEAEFFRTCGERYGESAVKILTERLSVSDRYIRKRIEILKLPVVALDLWRSGTWHLGHMEQLLRLGEHNKVSAFLEELDRGHREIKNFAVWQLKDVIDNLAVPLHSGKFDKTECKICRKNTDCQRRLFGGEKEKGTKCIDQSCFKGKQQAWCDLNWLTCKANKFGTQAALIGDYNTQVTGHFSGYSNEVKPGEKCASCSNFTTILDLQGEARYFQKNKVCLGPKPCFDEIQAASKKAERSSKGKQSQEDSEAPRVPWHGEYFRQQFYQQEIPQLVADLAEDDPRRLQLTLATFLYSARTLHEWFWQQLGREVPTFKNSWEYFSLSFHQLLRTVHDLEVRQVKELLAGALVKIALHTGQRFEISFIDSDRQTLAEFLNIDFARFQVTGEYLAKKTKTEIIRFIVHESGLMEEAKFKEFMEQRGHKTAEKLAQAKKGALVELILECQVDLHGRLPKEIADRPQLEAVHEHL